VETVEGGSSREPRRWPSRTVIGSVVAALVVSALVGFVVGARQAGSAAGTSDPPATSSPGSAQRDQSPAMTDTGNSCSAQIGNALQLGVEVANRSGQTLRLRGLGIVLPLGGLRATSIAVGTCGQLSGRHPVAGTAMPAGSTAWLTVTFDVLGGCPAPLPVQLSLSYAQNGHVAPAHLVDFADLGNVPYTGCQAG
jgi:hypothetical protein